MYGIKKKLIIIIMMQFFFQKGFAEIKLPAFFSDNMVLQQQSEAKIWGWATSNTKVKISTSWDRKVYSFQSDSSGKWDIKINTPKAGGPYTITISDGDELQLKNVLIGEVWICSGQSNMDVPLRGVPNTVTIKNSIEHIVNAKNTQIRLFTVGKKQSTSPQENCSGSWGEASAETASEFSAVGYLYAKYLNDALGIPVGIIKSAYSGTAIQAWMSEEQIKNYPELLKAPAGPKEVKCSELYYGMISPLMGLSVKGFLWYQGEGNHRDPELYAALLPLMVSDWRKKWEIGNFPFYFVQIAPYSYPDKGNAAKMRQEMANCVKTIPNSGIAIMTDAGEEFNIHPEDKEVVAKRLLYLALSKTYGLKGFPSCGPIYKSMALEADKIVINFDYAEMGLTTFGQPLLNFEIAGADGIYSPANAKIVKGSIEVWNTSISNPVGVRYAFKDWVKGELYNSQGLPVSSFQAAISNQN